MKGLLLGDYHPKEEIPGTTPHIPQGLETSEFKRGFLRIPDDVTFEEKNLCWKEKLFSFWLCFASSWLCDLRGVILPLQAMESSKE